MRAAVPKYVGGSFSTAPPGHRFRLYLEYWKRNWEPEKNSKKEALEEVLDLRPFGTQLGAVRNRQRHAAGEDAVTLFALSTAPFVTGMGMEHPLENGFAFLDPYGLPYLPGSSVKGVVRRAAEELALFEPDSKGWSIPAIWWLFGFDASSGFFSSEGKDDPQVIREERTRWREAYRQYLEGRRGDSPDKTPGRVDILSPFRKLVDSKQEYGDTNAEFLEKLVEKSRARRAVHTRASIAFWDVIPKPANHQLRIDILNPHYSHYYQENEAPHDAGSPKPNYYLTLPEGSEFTFIATLDPVGGLPEWFTEVSDGKARWQILLEAAFEHAFDWLGFGAKTSLGYGGMTANTGWRQAEIVEVKLENPKGQEGRRSRQRMTQRPPARQDSTSKTMDGLLGGGKLDERIRSVNPRDLEAIKIIADEIGSLESDNEKKLKKMALTEQVKGNPKARVLLNNHPDLKNL